ncbi:MAG TPA: DUF72 domain-containing protein [Caulobacteraceae bacterium]
MIRVGTAGWAIPRASAHAFPAEGTTLERYASLLSAAEINSSFYRPHRNDTYRRWAACVPFDFRFSVKLPRAITHERRLVEVEPLLEIFLGQVEALGPRLGALLVQLPPSLAFDERSAVTFFDGLRRRFEGAVVCEPRHPSWFGPPGERLLEERGIGVVAADPPRSPAGLAPGGWGGIAYFRLHGSPRTYWSAYGRDFLERLAIQLGEERAAETWCVFDNTASGAAATDALKLAALLAKRRRPSSGTNQPG